MKFPHAGAGGETGQIVTAAAAKSIDPDATAGPTNRVLLTASAAGSYFGYNPNVSTTTGFPIPAIAVGYLELWFNTPPEIFVVGGGETVYYALEQPEGQA